ncbi:MAG: protein translocase subunit SecF [Coriobacteriales bacterium]|jgi:SecD/SecF fusion protein|nr:protein translocase subunit SecF [Coriobacteriales bacterium]
MVRPFKKDINFLGHRKIFFIVSGVLILASIFGFVFRGGLSFGIEFMGGSSIELTNAQNVSIDQVRQAFAAQGQNDVLIQQASEPGGGQGYVIRTSQTDAAAASKTADAVIKALNLPAQTVQPQTIGSSWGGDVTRSMIIALIVAMALIIIYMAIRYEWKMGLCAIIALIHDIIIVTGFYAIFHIDVTPNVVAAMLTIMGYSLYDTVVVFHRIKDNTAETRSHSFMTVANHSINQTILRTINTTVTTLVPVVAMLIFGGETLQEFALAMTIGLISGSYSSIGIATPIYALWKQHEPKFKKLRSKFGEGVGSFSAAEDLGE